MAEALLMPTLGLTMTEGTVDSGIKQLEIRLLKEKQLSQLVQKN